MPDVEEIESELRGNTLRVYRLLLKIGRSAGAREVQRSLNFSSPYLAIYHLEKLKELGLVTKESGEYKVRQEVSVDILRLFVRWGWLNVPRFAFYTSFFAALLAIFAIRVFTGWESNFWSIFGLVSVVGGVAFASYETVRILTQRI